MYRKLLKGFFLFAIMSHVAACGTQDHISEKTAEENNLIKSFRAENPALQQHIAEIIADSKALRYQEAMNKLAMLSATTILTKEQKHAVDLLDKKLRYDMEEKIFSARDKAKDIAKKKAEEKNE